MNLKELKVGKTGRILAINGEGRLRNRLLDMGLIQNTQIKKIKVAPLGDPMQITVRGYELTLRNDDASLIEIEEVEL